MSIKSVDFPVDLVMFDIDGTLLNSCEIDEYCYPIAVKEVTGLSMNTDWSYYEHISDAGILMQVLRENGQNADDSTVLESVRQCFVECIRDEIKKQAITEIEGASKLLAYLDQRDDVALALATGGWRESAILKLEAAGLDIGEIPLLTSNDHYRRIDIMGKAETEAALITEVRTGSIASDQVFGSKTYFGDGEWDQQASLELGYQFVLVGNRLSTTPAVEDYTNLSAVLAAIGLSE